MAAGASRFVAPALVGRFTLAFAAPASAGAPLVVHVSSSAAHQALMSAKVALDAARVAGTPEVEVEANVLGMVALKDLPSGASARMVEHPAREAHEEALVAVASEMLHRDVELTPVDGRHGLTAHRTLSRAPDALDPSAPNASVEPLDASLVAMDGEESVSAP